MKHIRIVLMAIFAQFYIVSAFSAPYCEKGSLCAMSTCGVHQKTHFRAAV